MDRYLVISSDCHAGLPPEKYRDYLDPKYRDAFDHALPIQLEMTREAEKLFLVADTNADWRDGREAALTGAWDHDERVKVMDVDGVAGEVVFADGITEMNAPPFGAALSLPTENVVPELQWAGARAHNRWLAELVQMAPERRVGVALVPALWDVEEAVAEVRWARENGLSAVMLPTAWRTRAPYHHPRYEPLWSACEELDVVIHFHSGAAPMEDYFGPTPRPEGEPQLTGAVGIYISEVAWWNARPLTFLIWGGVFERHPGLKVAITEGTTIWVPEFLSLLDQRWGQTHYAAKLGDYHSHLSMKRRASTSRRNVKLGASCMPRREAELRHEIGHREDHVGQRLPAPRRQLAVHARSDARDTFKGLPPEDEVAAMLGRERGRVSTASTPRSSLPIVARVGPEKSCLRVGHGAAKTPPIPLTDSPDSASPEVPALTQTGDPSNGTPSLRQDPGAGKESPGGQPRVPRRARTRSIRCVYETDPAIAAALLVPKPVGAHPAAPEVERDVLARRHAHHARSTRSRSAPPSSA